MVNNGITPQPLATPHCEHVHFGFCGDCRPKEPAKVNHEQEIAEMKEKLAAMERFLNVRHKPEGPIPIVSAGPVAGPVKPIKLDLGCGTLARRLEMKNWTREAGWTGVDIQPSDGADVLCDLSAGKWPWEDASVDEVNCHHMLEHIPGKREEWKLEAGALAKGTTYPRAHFFNELWRVLKPGGKAAFITPYWGSCRAYGDITHEWPPVGEMSYMYLDKEWRKTQAPHDDFYTCDFTHGLGYAPGQHLVGRTPEYVQDAIRDHKEGAGDMLATLVCRK